MCTISSKDFSKSTLSALQKKGVRIIGVQAVPAFYGDKYFTGVAYMLEYNGHGFMRSHSQILVMAKSSWMPSTDTI